MAARYVVSMKPLTLRPLTDPERAALHAGLRSRSAFTLRRSQYLLASADGATPPAIARAYGGSDQGVRNVLRAFADRGLACLEPRSSAPKAPRADWPRDRDNDLKALVHQSPRTLGKKTGVWTLDLLAAVCHEKGWTARALTGEAIRGVFRRLGVGWKRAKHWLTSPDPEYAAKKKSGTT